MLYNRLQPVRFPAAEVIERCAARNIPMYRTDANGAVHAVSDGLKWTFTTESDRNINAQKDREGSLLTPNAR